MVRTSNNLSQGTHRNDEWNFSNQRNKWRKKSGKKTYKRKGRTHEVDSQHSDSEELTGNLGKGEGGGEEI